MRRIIAGLILLLALCVKTFAISYDAEADLGLIAENDSPAVAARNTQLLNAALDAQWSGGKFRFTNNTAGPILYPIQASAKEFFFAGTIQTSKRLGGSLTGSGGRSYPITAEHYSRDQATLRFKVARDCRNAANRERKG